MARQYLEPRRVEPRAFRRWFREVWRLLLRNPIMVAVTIGGLGLSKFVVQQIGQAESGVATALTGIFVTFALFGLMPFLLMALMSHVRATGRDGSPRSHFRKLMASREGLKLGVLVALASGLFYILVVQVPSILYWATAAGPSSSLHIETLDRFAFTAVMAELFVLIVAGPFLLSIILFADVSSIGVAARAEKAGLMLNGIESVRLKMLSVPTICLPYGIFYGVDTLIGWPILSALYLLGVGLLFCVGYADVFEHDDFDRVKASAGEASAGHSSPDATR